jgi:hypothetical protein
LIRTFTDTKKSRRLLRAKAVISLQNDDRDDFEVARDVYDEQMQIINEIQLELETIKQEVQTAIDTSSSAFTDPHKLRRNINSIESYLRKVVTEYEEKLKKFQGNPPSLPLSGLEVLKDFIGLSPENRFATKVLHE